jgi:hypothetical protein
LSKYDARREAFDMVKRKLRDAGLNDKQADTKAREIANESDHKMDNKAPKKTRGTEEN